MVSPEGSPGLKAYSLARLLGLADDGLPRRAGLTLGSVKHRGRWEGRVFCAGGLGAGLRHHRLGGLQHHRGVTVDLRGQALDHDGEMLGLFHHRPDHGRDGADIARR